MNNIPLFLCLQFGALTNTSPQLPNLNANRLTLYNKSITSFPHLLCVFLLTEKSVHAYGLYLLNHSQ